MKKNFKIKSKNNRSAFSLIELSLVLAIIAAIISGALSVSTSVLKNKKVSNSLDKISEIKVALESFVATNGRLPCPARLDLAISNTSFGLEDGNAGDCNNANDKAGTGTGASELSYGAVPVKALELDTRYAGDGFDNKFSYVVATGLTSQSQNSDSTLGFDSYSLTTHHIDINSTNPSAEIQNETAYALISHGANGLGAYNIYATSTNSTPSDADELSNRYIDTYDNDFVVSSNSSDFDDIVIYGTRDMINNELLGYGYTAVGCPAITFSDSNSCSGSSTITFPASQTGTTIDDGSNTGGTTCTDNACSDTSAPSPIDATYPSAVCGSNGNWTYYPCGE